MLGEDGTQPPALTLFLWHQFLKHLALKDKMATIYTVLNLLLLKKEVTYCLVSSHGLCLAGCVWRSQESLPKKEELSGFTNCLPSYPSITAHAKGHAIEETARNGMKGKGHIKAILLC